jgi:hypothetical protein
MPRKELRTRPKQKGGAKPGNKNAQRHGYYAKGETGFTADEINALSELSKDEDKDKEQKLQNEIDLLRVKANRLKNQISFDAVMHTDAQGNKSRNAHYLEQLNTMCNMLVSIGTLVRTQHLLKSKGGDIYSTIEQAWEEVRLELGI